MTIFRDITKWNKGQTNWDGEGNSLYLLYIIYNCGAERFGKPGSFRIKPKAYAKKEETFEDE